MVNEGTNAPLQDGAGNGHKSKALLRLLLDPINLVEWLDRFVIIGFQKHVGAEFESPRFAIQFDLGIDQEASLFSDALLA